MTCFRITRENDGAVRSRLDRVHAQKRVSVAGVLVDRVVIHNLLVEVSSDDEEELVEETPIVEVSPVEEAKESDANNEDSEDEEDEDFERLTYEGVKYLRDEENTLYLDLDDDVEPVGTWDPVSSTPKFNAGVDIQALLSGE